MTIEIRHSCEDFKSYRAARVKSLFNATTGYNWSKDVDLVSEACALIERTGNTQAETPQDERFATWEPSWNRPRLKRPELLRLGAWDGVTPASGKIWC